MPAYLDCNASAPLDPRVARALTEALGWVGNPSAAHAGGQHLSFRVDEAAARVARVVGRDPDELVFTSGATEANNLVIRGLAEGRRGETRRHIVTSAIEHRSVSAPLAALAARGFEIDRVPPGRDGRVSIDAMVDRVRPDTLLVSLHAAHPVTGVLQDVDALAEELADADVLLHVDAAQAYGKALDPLRAPIDLLTVSAHKIHGPVGVGGLFASPRARSLLAPQLLGGHQQGGLRAGTVGVALAHAFGVAASLAESEHAAREAATRELRRRALEALAPLAPIPLVDPAHQQAHVLYLALPGVEGASAVAALADLAWVATGSACESGAARPSPVLRYLDVDRDLHDCALRLTFSYLTEEPDWPAIVDRLLGLRDGSGACAPLARAV